MEPDRRAAERASAASWARPRTTASRSSARSPPAGYLWSVAAADGAHRWFGPVADGAHWGEPVAVANGVVYTVDLTGFLDAFDARTGALLAKRPLALGGSSSPASLAWGGVSVARNTVYAAVGISSLEEGFVVAFRRGNLGRRAGRRGEDRRPT